TLHPTPYTVHPAPYPLNPKPQTLNPQHSNLHPTPHALHPKPSTINPQPSTLNPSPYTLHPTPYTLHPTPYTLNSQPPTQASYHLGREHDHIREGYAPAVAEAITDHNYPPSVGNPFAADRTAREYLGRPYAAAQNYHIAAGDEHLQAGYSPAVAAAIRSYMSSNYPAREYAGAGPAAGLGPVPTYRQAPGAFEQGQVDSVRAARIRQLEIVNLKP
ncbi:hypothetical protein T484DRAFT_1612075, partial [Baffinella frigidus]